MRYNVNMQSALIVGSPESRNKYIDSYIQERQIPVYNVIRITETVKIALTRELKKRLSISSGGVMRVVILPPDITLDAQNALLKTIEELDAHTHILIESESRDSLLPTVVSRCTVVMLAASENIADSQSLNRLATMFQEENETVKIELAMKYIDSLGTITEDHVKQIIMDFRELLIHTISNSKKNVRDILEILKSLILLYPLCQNNNVNKRMMLESVFLGKIGYLTSL